MKKFLIFANCALLIGALASCGGSSDNGNTESEESVEAKTYVLTPKTTSITGPLGQAYEVVERDYKLKNTYGSNEIFVEVKLADPTKLPKGFDANKVGTRYDEGNSEYTMITNFVIEYLDEDGDIIESHNASGSDYKDLARISKGESSTVNFYAPNNADGIKYFRIKSDYYPNKIEGKAKEKESSSSYDSDTDDDDINKTLEQASKVAETAGKMVETAGEVMKGLNNLTK